MGHPLRGVFYSADGCPQVRQCFALPRPRLLRDAPFVDVRCEKENPFQFCKNWKGLEGNKRKKAGNPGCKVEILSNFEKIGKDWK